MLVKIYGGAINGIEASIVAVEVSSISSTKDGMVGLPDNAVRESLLRVRTALKNSGFNIGRKILVNLSPADIKKEGTAYDLPIAIGRLVVTEQLLSDKISDYMIMGELSLDGTLHSIKGALSIALEAKNKGYKGIILPEANAKEAVIVADLEVYSMPHLGNVIQFLKGEGNYEPLTCNSAELFSDLSPVYDKDFSDVKGQTNVKRAMEIAAAGGHNVLLIGPPGAGKTMLARRLPTILPPLTLEESLESTKIHSVTSKSDQNRGLITQRPFRSPHHTISPVALVGGGTSPAPGEISLAHNGVLFLDELTEFNRSVLEVMRQPLEERVISISRAKFSVDYPANFMLIASMNPCPCGYYNHPDKECVCPPGGVKKYLNKISGPLLDRIDLHVEVTPVSCVELNDSSVGESSKDVRSRVYGARSLQSIRFENSNTFANAEMTTKQIKKDCELDEECKRIITTAMERLGLSARAYDRIKKVARTIADLDSEEKIQARHLREAIQYRSLDRSDWAESH